MNLQPMSPAAAPTDADLVHRTLTEGAGAFADIVERYQTLICSLAYNATGSLSRSEDLAQEVFFAAWKELRQLRQPALLRPWLCGIARRLAANARRRDVRQPVSAAVELDEQQHATAPDPAEQTISREEEAILWRSLEQLPDLYREPLILYYRENQSVERVAEALDLSPDAAKQRLSRGRKLLQEQVARFVEGALRQSAPRRAFTLGVVAALPLMSASATAATAATAAAIGTTAAAKGGMAASGASLSAICGLLLGPVAGCLGAWFGIQASLESAESERERELIHRQTRQMIALIVGFLVLLGLAIPFEARIWHDHTVLAIALGVALPLLYVVALLTMVLRFNRAQALVRAAEAPRASPEAVARRAEAWKTFEYRSSWTLLGLPLVHVRTGRLRGEKLCPAVGWIAVGDAAIGLVAVGGLAAGGISIGGVSVGLVAFGGVSLGVLAFAGLAIGLWAAMGGLAFGYLAHGGCAIAWHAAHGAMAAAHDFALGDSAYATHANDAVAREAIASLGFFQQAQGSLRQPLWFNLVWLPIVLVIWQAQRARRALKQGHNPAH